MPAFITASVSLPQADTQGCSMGARHFTTTENPQQKDTKDRPMPKHNQYHVFGFANDVRVTAANKHLGLPPRHPHWCTCGGERPR